MKTTNKEEYTKKCTEIIKWASKWLVEHVDLIEDFKIHSYGLNIWSDHGGESPIRIVVTDGCGCVNGMFVKDPYLRWKGLDGIEGGEEPGRGSERSIMECAEILVAHWEHIKGLVEEHNKRIQNVIDFKMQ